MARRIIVSTEKKVEKKHYLTKEEKRILKANPELMGALKTDSLKSKSRKYMEKIGQEVVSNFKWEVQQCGAMLRVVRLEA